MIIYDITYLVMCFTLKLRKLSTLIVKRSYGKTLYPVIKIQAKAAKAQKLEVRLVHLCNSKIFTVPTGFM